MNAQTFRTRDDTSADLEKDGGRTDMLSVFREQVGITDVHELGPRSSKRKAPNLGIYNRVATEEREAKWQYIFSALLINTCLLAQVVFASALTALGAGNGSHTQITILGAANTVVAALLTFTKGQGLPNRLRQYQCSLRKVREYIEQRERDFAQLGCKLDIDSEIRVIKGMYEDARQTDENNDPSTYHPPVAFPAKDRPLPLERPQDQSFSRINPTGPSATRSKGHMDDLKDEEDITAAASQGVHSEPPAKNTRPEDSEKLKIAYSVADRLVSSKHAW